MDRRHFLCLSGIMTAALSLGLSPLVCEAEARGSSQQEAARAKAIFDELETTGAKSERRMLQGNGIHILAPGEIVTFDMQGFCLDSSFSAPKQNEPLTFRPMSQYIAPELRELYIKILQHFASSAAKGVDMQKIIWAIRAPAAASWTSGLGSKEKAFLNAAMPGGAALIREAHRPAEYQAEAKTDSRNGRGGNGAEDVLGALLPLLNAQLPFNVQQHSNELMRQLHNKRAQKPMPDASNRYSMLTTAGVAGLGLGLGGLSVRGSVANGSPEPFYLDTTQWVLESSRDVQAVALPPMSKISIKKGKSLPNTGRDSTPDEKMQSPTKNKKAQSGAKGQERIYDEFSNSPVR